MWEVILNSISKAGGLFSPLSVTANIFVSYLALSGIIIHTTKDLFLLKTFDKKETQENRRTQPVDTNYMPLGQT